MNSQSTIACLGDSITKGRFSYNWIAQLRGELPGVEFKNFGKDGELAFNALNRLDKVIACDPDHVFILLGTNDVYSLMSEENTKRYMKNLQLPRRPDLEWFAYNMEQIIIGLKTRSAARINVISLPVMGEDPRDVTNQTVDRYNAEISRLCQKHEVAFLNLNYHMKKYLYRNLSEDPLPLKSGLGLLLKSAIRKYLMFQDWNTISAKHGMRLTTDGIHLNGVSGILLANLVRGRIEQQISIINNTHDDYRKILLF